MRPGANNDIFMPRAVRPSYSLAKQLSMVEWMAAVYSWYSYYTHERPDWDDEHWARCWSRNMRPNAAVHELIDGPEYEVDESIEAHVDADVLAAREAVWG